MILYYIDELIKFITKFYYIKSTFELPEPEVKFMRDFQKFIKKSGFL